jgi:hypothetical protein
MRAHGLAPIFKALMILGAFRWGRHPLISGLLAAVLTTVPAVFLLEH